MATKKLRAVHPGDILRHDFMEPLGLSAYKLAKELGVTAPTVNEMVRRRRAVTAEMALRLSRYFGTTAQLWQNLQSQYDLEIASQKIGKRVERGIRPLPRPDLGGRSSLQRALAEYMAHYHHERNHQGVGNRLLQSTAGTSASSGPIRRRQRLGGMLSLYHRAVAA